MSTLTAASQQWASRPADERFANLYDMQASMTRLRGASTNDVVSNRKIQLFPAGGDDRRGLRVRTEGGALDGLVMEPTHKSFGQICSLASPGNSPAAYFIAARFGKRMVEPLKAISAGNLLQAA